MELLQLPPYPRRQVLVDSRWRQREDSRYEVIIAFDWKLGRRHRTQPEAIANTHGFETVIHSTETFNQKFEQRR